MAQTQPHAVASGPRQGEDELELLEIELLLEGVHRRYGFDFREYAPASLKRRLRRRMSLEDVETVSALQELVLDPRVDWVFETPATNGPAVPQTFRLDSLVDVALRQRVDIQAQLYRVRAAESEVAIARGTRLPTVTGSAGFGTAFTSGNDQGVLQQLDAALTAKGYFHPPSRTQATRNTIRTIFTKTGWSSREVKAVRGVIRALVNPPRQR